jgi:beta-lactamase class D
LVPSKDNLVGLEYLKKDGLSYLDNRVVLPAGEARERVQLEEAAHDSPYSGDFGKQKVLHQITQNSWWSGWRKNVENYVFGCLVCQRNKAQTVKKAEMIATAFCTEL